MPDNKDYKELNEGTNAVKSSYEDSDIEDFTVAGKGKTKRPTDTTSNSEPMNPAPTKDHVEGPGPKRVLRPADNDSHRMPMKGIKEEIESIFENDDTISEDFKNKAATIFEAVINQRINEEIEALNEQYEASLNEAVLELDEKYAANIDRYFDYLADTWFEQNEMAVEEDIRLEMAESLVDSMKQVFMEHNIEIEDEDIDIVNAMEEEMVSLEDQLNEVKTENLQLREQVELNELKEAFDDLTEDLSLAEAEQLESLIEGLSYEDVDDFSTKVKILKEKYFDDNSTDYHKSIEEYFDGEPLDEDVVPNSPAVDFDVQKLFEMNQKNTII